MYITKTYINKNIYINKKILFIKETKLPKLSQRMGQKI